MIFSFEDFLNEEKDMRDDHYFSRIDKGEVSGLQFRNWEKITNYIKTLKENPEGITLTKLVGVLPNKQKVSTNTYARQISWLYLKKLITIKKGEKKGQAHTIKPTEKLLNLPQDQIDNPRLIANKEFLSSKIIEILDKFPQEEKISKFILSLENNTESLQHLYLNIESEPGNVSFLPSNRERNVENEEFWKNRYRQTTTIGKLVRALCQKDGVTFPDAEIEKFGNTFKSIQMEVTIFKNFKLVQGQEIKHWYNYSNYFINEGSPLDKSCMKHDKCESFFSVYTENPNVSLLFLTNDDGKLIARAIVWNNVEMEDGKKITLMDRIYYNSDVEVDLFKTYAKRKNWWFKVVQSHKDGTISNSNNINYTGLLRFDLPTAAWSKINKPYLDTLKYFNNSTVIKNENDTQLYNYDNSQLRLLEPGEKVTITDKLVSYISHFEWGGMNHMAGNTYTVYKVSNSLEAGYTDKRVYYFKEDIDFFIPADCIQPIVSPETYIVKETVKGEKRAKYYLSNKITTHTKQMWTAIDGTYKRPQ